MPDDEPQSKEYVISDDHYGDVLTEKCDVIEVLGVDPYREIVRGRESGREYEHWSIYGTGTDHFMVLVKDNPWADKPIYKGEVSWQSWQSR
jgi:hypothetical protein